MLTAWGTIILFILLVLEKKGQLRYRLWFHIAYDLVGKDKQVFYETEKQEDAGRCE